MKKTKHGKSSSAKRKDARPARRQGKTTPEEIEFRSDATLRSSLGYKVEVPPSNEEPATLSAGQAGDLQGISDIEEADSESVGELLEDGQSFEAEVVNGVENVRDEQEVPVQDRAEVAGTAPPGQRTKNMKASPRRRR